MNRVTLYLPPDLENALAELANQRQCSRAALIREALSEYVERHNRPLPAWIGMIDVQDDFDSTNVKSWLREHATFD
jgi:predicted transcriptional regulator